MKRLSLFLGALGGAMAGYILSNKKLRDQLSKSKDAQGMAALLGKHLQTDGTKLAKHVKEFVESDEVQANLSKAKQYAQQVTTEAMTEMKKLVSPAKPAPTKVAHKRTTTKRRRK